MLRSWPREKACCIPCWARWVITAKNKKAKRHNFVGIRTFGWAFLCVSDFPWWDQGQWERGKEGDGRVYFSEDGQILLIGFRSILANKIRLLIFGRLTN